MSGDADHITAAREDGQGALMAMRQALKVAFFLPGLGSRALAATNPQI